MSNIFLDTTASSNPSIINTIDNIFSYLTVSITGDMLLGNTGCTQAILTSVEYTGTEAKCSFHIESGIILYSGNSLSVDVSAVITDTGNVTLSDDSSCVSIQAAVHKDAAPTGTYECNLPVLLRNIIVLPVRYITIGDKTTPGGMEMSDGFNTHVSYNDSTIVINGYPGAGLGKYMTGGVDSIYRGIRTVNGINSNNNIDITMSDLVTGKGGRINEETTDQPDPGA